MKKDRPYGNGLSRKRWRGFVFVVLLLGAGSFGEQESKSTETELKPVSPELAKLELFVGSWQVAETHFDEAGNVVGTARGTEDTRWILDQRAVQRTYTTKGSTRTYLAIGTFAYNELEKKYHGVWFDNVSKLGPTAVKADWDADTRSFVCMVDQSAADGTTVHHKLIERFADPQTRLATTFLLRGTQVVKTLEVRYTRTTPCPSSIRVLEDR